MKHQYKEISKSEIPPRIRFDVLRQDQGQIIEKAYGHDGRDESGYGDPYMRIVDYSEAPGKRTTFYKLVK